VTQTSIQSQEHHKRPGNLLAQDFYAREALVVARELLGAFICKDDIVLRITEVEAYRWPGDSASHGRFGKTARNEALWGPAGHAYVYICYGIHAMLNLVTNEEGEAAGVLIRSCDVVHGLEAVLKRRRAQSDPMLLAGPGKVGQALALSKSDSHHPLFAPGGIEVRRGARANKILTGPRVGIDYSDEKDRLAPWRFALADARAVTARHALK
jgi:DNA-3-methyladenine glycosylase